jgi:hypothetical protein
MNFAWPEAVVIASSREDVLAGALPRLFEGGVVSWFEGQHHRAFEVAKVLADETDRFRFEDERGDWFELQPMTLELYEERVRPKTRGRPKFETLAELVTTMRNEW